jgi:subtilisin family serine protease
MSFAGPADPAIHRALQAAHRKGIVLIAAAGNAGAKSPPLYPAADADVIAVTGTDAQDRLITVANRGRHIAVAAPGADLLVAIPGGSYEVSSGTSYAAAEVSGIAALLIERKSELKPEQIRGILTGTAKDLGPKGRDPEFGAGLADAYAAVNATETPVARANTGAR